MFSRPGGAFSSSLSPETLNQRAVEQDRAYQARASRSCFDIIDELKEGTSNTQEKELLGKLKGCCERIFSSMQSVDTNVAPLRFKAALNIICSEMEDPFNGVKLFKRDEIDQISVNGELKRIRAFMEQSVDQRFTEYLQKITPAEDPTFKQFSVLRNDPLYVKAINEALESFNAEIVDWSLFSKNTLLCGNVGDRDYLSDLIDHLGMVKIRAQTIEMAMQHSSPAQLMGEYSQFRLPHQLILFESDHTRLPTQADEVWNYVLYKFKDCKKPKIYPVVLSGNRQIFWPKLIGPEENVISLLPEFPVGKKGYHVVLFEILKQFCETENQLSAYERILGKFKSHVY